MKGQPHVRDAHKSETRNVETKNPFGGNFYHFIATIWRPFPLISANIRHNALVCETNQQYTFPDNLTDRQNTRVLDLKK